LFAGMGMLAACENRYEISAEAVAPKEERTLAVSAKAVLDVAPDEAAIDFAFSSTDRRITRSHALNAEKIDAFVKALGEAGVTPEDILYGQASYAPDYAYEEGKPPRIATYTATTSLTVKTRDFSRIPSIIDAAVTSGLTNMGSARFYSTQLPSLKKKVRDMALEAAREKAQQLAKGLGIGLGKAIGVSEGDAISLSSPLSSSWPYGLGANAVENAHFQVAQSRASQAAPSEPARPISPGTTPLELTVNCVFEIE